MTTTFKEVLDIVQARHAQWARFFASLKPGVTPMGDLRDAKAKMDECQQIIAVLVNHDLKRMVREARKADKASLAERLEAIAG